MLCWSSFSEDFQMQTPVENEAVCITLGALLFGFAPNILAAMGLN